MTHETVTHKEPGQRSWASALSKIAEPYRSALADGLRAQGPAQVLAARRERAHLSELEQRMLCGGRSLSVITHAAFIAFHLLAEHEVADACDALRAVDTKSLTSFLFERLAKAQKVLIVGDDPSPEAVEKAMAQCLQDGPIGVVIAGPGNLMESAIRTWAQQSAWPNAFLRCLDGSDGDVWLAQGGHSMDQAVCSLFDVHKPTRLALLEPVRLPATQSTIEQARRRKLPLLTLDALQLRSGPS